MVEVDISIIFAGLSIAASIVYYASVLRNANKTQQMQLETRQAQLYMQLFKEIYTPDFWKLYLELATLEWEDYEDFTSKIRENDRDTYAKFLSLWWTFGEIGTLLFNGLIEIEHVFQLLAEMPILAYNRWWPVIERLRMEWNNQHPEYQFQNFEYLAQRMMKEYDTVRIEVLDKVSADIQKWTEELS